VGDRLPLAGFSPLLTDRPRERYQDAGQPLPTSHPCLLHPAPLALHHGPSNLATRSLPPDPYNTGLGGEKVSWGGVETNILSWLRVEEQMEQEGA
jgi:hypothetical protein